MPEPEDDVEATEARAEQQARLEADAALVGRLGDEGFDPRGPAWIELTGILIEYGYSVFKGWFQLGTVYRAAADLGGGGVRGLTRLPRDLRLQDDDAHDLTMTLLEAAIPKFRETLVDGRWDPDGGASLRTFFIGRCLMQLPDVHERWRRQQDRWANEVIDLDVLDLNATANGSDPEAAALAAVQLDELLPPRDHAEVRLMIDLSQSGFTMADIARRFSEAGFACTEATVRTRISRARIRARDRHNQSERGESRER